MLPSGNNRSGTGTIPKTRSSNGTAPNRRPVLPNNVNVFTWQPATEEENYKFSRNIRKASNHNRKSSNRDVINLNQSQHRASTSVDQPGGSIRQTPSASNHLISGPSTSSHTVNGHNLDPSGLSEDVHKLWRMIMFANEDQTNGANLTKNNTQSTGSASVRSDTSAPGDTLWLETEQTKVQKDNIAKTNTVRKPEAEQVIQRLNQIREYMKQSMALMDSLRNSTNPMHVARYNELLTMNTDLLDSEKKLLTLLDTLPGKTSKTVEMPFPVDNYRRRPAEVDTVSEPDNDELLGAYAMQLNNTSIRNQLQRKMKESKQKLQVLEDQQRTLISLHQNAARNLSMSEATSGQGSMISDNGMVDLASCHAYSQDLKTDLESLQSRLQIVQHMLSNQHELEDAYDDETDSKLDNNHGTRQSLQNTHMADLQKNLQEAIEKKQHMDQLIQELQTSRASPSVQATLANAQAVLDSVDTESKQQQIASMREKLNQMQRVLMTGASSSNPADYKSGDSDEISEEMTSLNQPLDNATRRTKVGNNTNDLQLDGTEMKLRTVDKLLQLLKSFEDRGLTLSDLPIDYRTSLSDVCQRVLGLGTLDERTRSQLRSWTCANTSCQTESVGARGMPNVATASPPSDDSDEGIEMNLHHQIFSDRMTINTTTNATWGGSESQQVDTVSSEEEGPRPLSAPTTPSLIPAIPQRKNNTQPRTQARREVQDTRQQGLPRSTSSSFSWPINNIPSQMAAVTTPVVTASWDSVQMSVSLSNCYQLLWTQQQQIVNLQLALLQQQGQGTDPRPPNIPPSNSDNEPSSIHTAPIIPPPPPVLPLGVPTATLNNQVAPGSRANNYWDNFRSYSRQNLLSCNKTNENVETGNRRVVNHSTQHVEIQASALPIVELPIVAMPPPRQKNLAASRSHDSSTPEIQQSTSSSSTTTGSTTMDRSTGTIQKQTLRSNNSVLTSRSINEQSVVMPIEPAMREEIYAEVAALISQNETEPTSLLGLFQELRKIGARPQNLQTALSAIQSLSTLPISTNQTPPSHNSTQSSARELSLVHSSTRDSTQPSGSKRSQLNVTVDIEDSPIRNRTVLLDSSLDGTMSETTMLDASVFTLEEDDTRGFLRHSSSPVNHEISFEDVNLSGMQNEAHETSIELALGRLTALLRCHFNDVFTPALIDRAHHLIMTSLRRSEIEQELLHVLARKNGCIVGQVWEEVFEGIHLIVNGDKRQALLDITEDMSINISSDASLTSSTLENVVNSRTSMYTEDYHTGSSSGLLSYSEDRSFGETSTVTNRTSISPGSFFLRRISTGSVSHPEDGRSPVVVPPNCLEDGSESIETCNGDLAEADQSQQTIEEDESGILRVDNEVHQDGACGGGVLPDSCMSAEGTIENGLDHVPTKLPPPDLTQTSGIQNTDNEDHDRSYSPIQHLT